MTKIINPVWVGLSLFMCLSATSGAQTVLTVAAYPAVDEIIKAALPEWQKKHPQIHVKVVGREYADHHTAMTTALAASSGLPDVMTIEYGYLGRFSQSGGLENLAAEPYRADLKAERFVSYAWQQGQHDRLGQTAIPSDIGPGALFYRQDIVQKAQVKPEQLSGRWEDLIEAGKQIKARTGVYLVAHSRDIKDIVIRSGLGTGEGIYYNEQGQSVVGTSPRFRRAFELAKQVRQEGLDAKVNAWSNEWGESLKRGNVAVQMMGGLAGGALAKLAGTGLGGQMAQCAIARGVGHILGRNLLRDPQKGR